LDPPTRNYTLDSFYAWLNESAKDFSRKLKLVCLLSSFRTWKEQSQVLTLERVLERRGFEIRTIGEIRELSAVYADPETQRDVSVKFYCHLEKNTQILRCFTTARQKDIDKTLSPVTEGPGLYHLWISPRAFEEIKARVLQRPGAKVTRFFATRVSSMNPSAKIRPEFRRSMNYSGEDAQETLDEIGYQYGIIPDSMHFRIPGIGALQISKRGMFSYFGGEMSFLTEVSKLAIDLVLETKKIIESSRIEALSMKTARKELQLTHFRPWKIELERTIGPEEVEDLFRELENNKFAVYNSIVMKGSLHAESTILDEVKRTVFTLMADDHGISVSPRYESSFESFFRFYQTVVEKFDSGALCTTSAST
jgi:hypothetical protein